MRYAPVRYAPVRYAPVRYAPVRYAPVRYTPVRWYLKPPEGSPEGVPFSEASSRAKRALRRAKRGRPAERSEAPPSEARLHRGSAERSEAGARRSSGGRHYKKTQKGSTRKPRGTTYLVVVYGESSSEEISRKFPEKEILGVRSSM